MAPPYVLPPDAKPDAQPSDYGDWVENGPRNELSNLKEDCGSKYYPMPGETRFYSVSVYLPADFPTSIRSYNELPLPMNNIFWQIHEAGNCVQGGPYAMLTISRSDGSAGGDYDRKGNQLMFQYREKTGYTLGATSTRILPPDEMPTWMFMAEPGHWYHFVIKKKWMLDATGETGVYMWKDGERVAGVYPPNKQTLWTWPSPDLCAEEEARREAGPTVMPLYIKTGIYTQPGMPEVGLTIANVRAADNCADVWPPGVADANICNNYFPK